MNKDQALVRVEHEDDVVVVILDNPPVNASTVTLRQNLLVVITELSKNPDVAGAVLIGAGRNFISGSDLKEFSGPLADPQLPEVIAAIETAPFPVVAAISGAALGGGYELALGCDGRIGAPDAVVGLPEVKLGIIPGAGGTQRLPRLVGESKAIDLICTGARVKAVEALNLGMLDSISDGDLREDAITFLRGFGGEKRRLADKTLAGDPDELVEAKTARALRGNKGVPAAEAAVASVRRAAMEPFNVALAKERSVFQDLRVSAEASALRYQFFAERDAKRIPALESVETPLVRSVGVIGTGTMGAGIAICFLNAGYHVTMLDVSDDALAAGLARINGGYDAHIAAGRMTQAQVYDRLSRLDGSLNRKILSTADLIVEAIVERLDVKQSLFAELETIVGPNAVLATNTSYLDIDAVAGSMIVPSRLIGMHFFSPADRMPLLEIVTGTKSDPAALAAAFAVGRKLGKAAVLAKSAEGFIGNRIYSAYREQCEFMIEEGATPQQVDQALTDFGFALGPFAVSDMSGLDIAQARRARLADTRDPLARYVDIADRLCNAGRLGRKTGMGWYSYPDDRRVGCPDAEVDEIIRQSRKVKGVKARWFTNPEILSRALGAIVNEAALVVEDGIAQKPSDVDVVMVNGYGFPSHKGGPLYWARQLGDPELKRITDLVEIATGHGFRRAEYRDMPVSTNTA